MMTKPKAFTLIELLVVIAIIALLLAILSPALKKAKEQARAVTCRSNLHQIGLAANLYAESYDNFIPRGASFITAIWFNQFLPFLGHQSDETDYRSVKIYRCPSFPRTGVGLGNVSNSKQTVSYVINDWSFDGGGTQINNLISMPSKVTEFKSPASKIYLADNEAGDWRPIIEDRDSDYLYLCDVYASSHLPESENTTDISFGRRIPRDRHNKGCNVLFFDWHSDHMPAEDMTENMWQER